jgi:hypothetical protein
MGQADHPEHKGIDERGCEVKEMIIGVGIDEFSGPDRI